MSVFNFKKFKIQQANSALKVGTDAMVLGAVIDGQNKRNALDIGTGTGVLALMIAQRNPQLKITAVEIDENSSTDATANFKMSPYSDQISIFKGDFLSFELAEVFDLIFTNPPFYEDKLKSENDQSNLAKHVASLTLELLLEKASDLLSKSGSFWIIWPSNQMEKLKECALQVNFKIKTNILIQGKPNHPVRIIVELVKEESVFCEKYDLIIRHADGSYTDEYKKLTRDFHDREL